MSGRKVEEERRGEIAYGIMQCRSIAKNASSFRNDFLSSAVKHRQKHNDQLVLLADLVTEIANHLLIHKR